VGGNFHLKLNIGSRPIANKWSLSASALVSVAPLIVVAFIVERYLSKGNLSGAIK